jgi:hypothetical protein
MLDGPLGQPPAGFVPRLLRIGRTFTRLKRFSALQAPLRPEVGFLPSRLVLAIFFGDIY